MKSTKYLQQVAEKFGLTTKTAVAEKLDISKQAISNYLSETRVMDEETCLAVALALDINPVEVMMAAGIDRAEKTGQKSLWEVFSRRTATAASVALLTGVVTLFVTPTPSEAAPQLKSDGSSLCIMSNQRPRRLHQQFVFLGEIDQIQHAVHHCVTQRDQSVHASQH